MWKQLIFLFVSIKVSRGVVFFPGNRPGVSSGGGNFPIIGGSFPSGGGSFPSSGGNFPTSGGNFPTSGGNFPSTGGFFPPPGSSFPVQGQTFPVPCNSQVEVFPGVSYSILSPGYPSPSPPWTLCRWYFFVRDVTRRMTITCQDFSLPASSDCRGGPFLAIASGANGYQWFCGENGPRNVASTSNILEAVFWASWASSAASKGVSCTVGLATAAPASRTCRCGQRGTNNPMMPGLETNRVVGGVAARLHEFPWVVLLLLPENRFCGGVLINELYVLTAAHCIRPPALPTNTLPEVVVGEHDRTRADETASTRTLSVSRVINHESYNESITSENDIGLVQLSSALDFAATWPDVAPACPPDALSAYDSANVTVAGWGYLSYPSNPSLPRVLQKVDVQTVPVSECMKQYKKGKVTQNMICASAPGKDACFSDSGGPLMAQQGDRWVVIGIVSFGPSACAQPGVAGVYTRVGNYLPWIIDKIGNARTCPP
ncbi:venom serine protease isoform X2 [Penaeus vannamei]